MVTSRIAIVAIVAIIATIAVIAIIAIMHIIATIAPLARQAGQRCGQAGSAEGARRQPCGSPRVVADDPMSARGMQRDGPQGGSKELMPGGHSL